MQRTLLGRLRIVASDGTRRREIIINPNTGEVLRDYWVELSDDDEDDEDVNVVISPAGPDDEDDDVTMMTTMMTTMTMTMTTTMMIDRSC